MRLKHGIRLSGVIFSLLVAFCSAYSLQQSVHSGLESGLDARIKQYEWMQHATDEQVGPILEVILGPGNQKVDELTDQLVKARREHKTLQCFACLEFMRMIDSSLSENSTQQQLNDLATAICVMSGLLTPRVCVMGTNEWAPHVYFLLINDVLASQQVCYELFGSSCASPVVTRPDWTLEFPDTPKPAYIPPTSPPSGTEFARVLHLSDIHIDIYYDEGSDAQCGEPLCCRSVDGKPDNPADAAGKYGSLASCDSPRLTLEKLFSKLAAENFDWIIVTGDLPSHDVYNQTTEDNAYVISVVNDLLYEYFPNATLLQAVGNHAAAPVNIFIPPYMTEDHSPAPMAWLYEMLAEKWSRWLPESTLATIRKGGFWAWEFTPGLKVISMNSAYGQDGDWYTIVNNTDVHGMLQWMIRELQDAEDRGIKVWFLSHHPGYTLPYYEHQFDQIIHRYINVIVGWFNGHTHKDELRLFYDPSLSETSPVPVLTGYVAPSVTTYSDTNMAYRVYYVDAKRPNATFRVADYDTYFLNITEANEKGNATWNLEYNVKQTYNLPSLLPSDVDNLLARMLNDSSIAQQYKYYYHKSSEDVSCDEFCAKRVVKKIQQTLHVSEDH